ncbi:hypothetical protein [Nitrincola sp.]|uniref:hypothetical protein n=1 Tax=Nitrincola sp. TaxID=1926584 RepID=UPI003A8DD535
MKSRNEKSLMTSVDAQLLQHKHQVEKNSLEVEAEMLMTKLNSRFVIDPEVHLALALSHELHGRLKFIRGMGKFLRASEIKAAKEIKESKLYRHILVTDEFGITREANSFADYCKYGLGCSVTTMYEAIQDFDLFGEALDGLRQMGVDRNQLRLLRKSPEGLILEVKEAAEKEDKTALLELIDDIAARHAKEKEQLAEEKKSLADQVHNLEADRQVDQRLLEDKERKINELERELRRDLTPDQASQKRAERDELLKANLLDKSLSSISTLNELAGVVERVMELDDAGEHLEETLYAELRGVFRHALLLGRQYDLLPEQLLGLPVADLSTFDRVLEGEVM